MNLIAAVDENWGIGLHNRLLADIPEDKKRFRELTAGKVAVMGRRTYESIPGGLLKGRVNVILTHNAAYTVRGAVVVHSIEELQKELEAYDSGDVFVVGGGSVYRQLLEACDTAYITKIGFAYQADAYFPDLDRLPEWEQTEESEEQTCFDLVYYYVKYEKKS